MGSPFCICGELPKIARRGKRGHFADFNGSSEQKTEEFGMNVRMSVVLYAEDAEGGETGGERDETNRCFVLAAALRTGGMGGGFFRL